MKIRSITGARILPLVLTMLAAISCTKEQLIDTGGLPDVPYGMVRMELFTNAENYKLPVTKATENTVDAEPWVLVFDKVGSSEIFIEVQKAITQNSKTYAILTKTDQPRQLLVIANAPATFRIADNDPTSYNFDKATLTSLLTGKSLKKASELLLTSPLPVTNEKVQTLPYAGSAIPMSVVWPVDKIDGSNIGNQNNKLKLQRIVAKVTVDASAASATFTLQGVTVVNTPKSGTFVNYGTAIKGNSTNLCHYNYAADGTGFIISDAQIVDNSSTGVPIYMYESVESTTSILVKGIYGGKTLYYRLAFQTNNSRINVLRSHYYEFVISSVTGPGYDTPDQALLAPPSNLINYDLKVVDLSSHDIIDNGIYYLGASNSELIVYDLPANGPPSSDIEVMAVTMSTNIPLSLIPMDGNGVFESSNPDKLYRSWSDDVFSDNFSYGHIYVMLTPEFKAGDVEYITIKLGNLTKRITVRRERAISSLEGGTLIDGKFNTGFIDSDQSLPYNDWLYITRDGNATDNRPQKVIPSDEGAPVYLMANDNITLNNYETFAMAKSGTTKSRAAKSRATYIDPNNTAVVYLTRQSNEGRLKLYIKQYNYDVQSTDNTGQIADLAYVGTFHRWSQSGERVIKIGDKSFDPANGGMWKARVVIGDYWITLGSGGSKDPNIYTNNPGDPEDFQVEGDAISVSGNYTGTNAPILFRVGLKEKYEWGGNDQPRYGLILLEYGASRKIHRIFVRQGERADFVMRYGDYDANYNIVADDRDCAQEFSPFNLTAQTLDTQVDIGKGIPVTYPTQAGALWQWVNPDSGLERYAFNPYAASVSIWSNLGAWTSFWNDIKDTYETCPRYCYRPTDGPTDSYNTNGDVAGSQMRQSLYLNPPTGFDSSPDNSVWGYYADGFFDRRPIISSPTGAQNSTVGSGADIAYVGRLIYNPRTNASLFLPASGFRRIDMNGVLLRAGERSFFWSGSLHSSGNAWMLNIDNDPEYMQCQSLASVSTGCSIRYTQPTRYE